MANVVVNSFIGGRTMHYAPKVQSRAVVLNAGLAVLVFALLIQLAPLSALAELLPGGWSATTRGAVTFAALYAVVLAIGRAMHRRWPTGAIGDAVTLAVGMAAILLPAVLLPTVAAIISCVVAYSVVMLVCPRGAPALGGPADQPR